MKFTFLICSALALSISMYGQQTPSIGASHLLGGSDDDYSGSITVSGGDIYLSGATTSSDGMVSGFQGNGDIWLVKLDWSLNFKWGRCLGGSRDDVAGDRGSIKPTFDGGLVIAGFTNSTDGDISSRHDSLSNDCWIVKVDSSGSTIWETAVGGTSEERATTIMQTPDSGFVFIGHTISNDFDVSGLHDSTSYDAWLVKLNSSGSIVWQRCIGGTDSDFGEAVIGTSDGNLVIAGRTRSNDGDIVGNHSQLGTVDIFVMKVSPTDGNVIWSKCFGGTSDDQLSGLVENSDGTLMLGLLNGSLDGDFQGYNSIYDFVLFKLDSQGNKLWHKGYGGTLVDKMYSLIKSHEGGYLLTGITRSVDGEVGMNYGHQDLWMVKIDDTGMIQWKRTAGGSGNEVSPSVTQAPDSNYFFAAFTNSQDHDLVAGTNNFSYDIWVFKLNTKTAIDDIPNYSEGAVKLFPTLSNGSAILELKDEWQHVDIKVVTGDGKVGQPKISKLHSTKYELKELGPGLNLVIITTKKFVSVQKVIVVR